MIARLGRSAGAMLWAEQAACRNTEPELLFASGAEQHRAKRICQPCPVQLDCLTEALDNRIEFGVWGGWTERQRRRVLTQNPNVTSWRPVLMRPAETSPRTA